MRIIIAGGRDFNKYILLKSYCNNVIHRILFHTKENPDSIEFVSGHANGADKLGERYALEEFNKVSTLFPAEWNKYFKAAGPMRNAQMANYASRCPYGTLIAFWDKQSHGTANMIQVARDYNLNVFTMYYNIK